MRAFVASAVIGILAGLGAFVLGLWLWGVL
jgi:hypothetical protein